MTDPIAQEHRRRADQTDAREYGALREMVVANDLRVSRMEDRFEQLEEKLTELMKMIGRISWQNIFAAVFFGTAGGVCAAAGVMLLVISKGLLP